MKAVAIIPRRPGSAHLRDIAKPEPDTTHNGRAVLVKVLRVGVDGTDRDLYQGSYGAPPSGSEFLVTGHENFGRVLSAGSAVVEMRPGDYAVATVRRPGKSIYDLIGRSDLTTDSKYFERGISLLHGFLTEYYVDSADYMVRVPAALNKIAVLLEPFSIVQKGIAEAYRIQERLGVWHPKRGAVMGAGSIGLLATLALRLRGLMVTTFALPRKPNVSAELVEAAGAQYESTQDTPVLDGSRKHGPFDLIFEATGYSPIAFESMQAVGKNGVLVLASVTGGNRKAEVPTDEINQAFVLGNKLMVGTVNANKSHFEAGVRDMALAQAQYPGWLERLLTHRVEGLQNYEELYRVLTKGEGVIKAFCEVAEA